MQNNIFKKLNPYHYKRYLLVLVLFISAFIFGKNMDVLSPQQKQLQNQADAKKKITFGIYDVSVDQSEYELKDIFSIKQGQCGRLFFALKNLPSSGNSADSAENPKIKILLSSNFDQNQELGSYEIKSDRFTQNEKIDFCANADYQNLLFEKDENSQNSSFEISNVSYYPIAIEKHDFIGLMDPIEGNTNFSNIIYQSSFGFKDANKAFKFSRKNQKIGQTFVADSETISGVDLKLEFTRTGGIGNYHLELREIENQNGKIQLSSDRIAYFYFNKDNAEKNLKIGGGVYHIPLAAHLEKGKTYFIGISNEAISFNILNTLKIYGGSGNSGGKKIISFVGGKTSEKSGSLYLKIYGADYVKVADDKVLTGAKILDNGDGTGLYIYNQKGNFSDYLDIGQLITKGNSNIFYDNVQSGISAKDEDDNAFVYKINTLHPFTLAKIEAGQPGGEFTDSLVYYSFDNNNWQEIKSDLNKEDTLLQGDEDKFQELVQGDGKIKTIYIKVTYDKYDVKEQGVHLFGLKNLKVSAKLKF